MLYIILSRFLWANSPVALAAPEGLTWTGCGPWRQPIRWSLSSPILKRRLRLWGPVLFPLPSLLSLFLVFFPSSFLFPLSQFQSSLPTTLLYSSSQSRICLLPALLLSLTPPCQPASITPCHPLACFVCPSQLLSLLDASQSMEPSGSVLQNITQSISVMPEMRERGKGDSLNDSSEKTQDILVCATDWEKHHSRTELVVRREDRMMCFPAWITALRGCWRAWDLVEGNLSNGKSKAIINSRKTKSNTKKGSIIIMRYWMCT